MANNKMDMDKMEIGCYHVGLFFMLGFLYSIVATNHVLPAFHNYTPKYFCEIPNENKTYGCTSESSPIRNQTEHFIGQFKSCPAGYHFENVGYESSVVTEWNLICERRFLGSLSTSIYFIGVLIGAWISAFVVDRFGRLPVMAMCLYTQGALGASLYIVQDYSTFLIIRGLQGLFVQGMQAACYTLMIEIFPIKVRTIIGIFLQIFFAFGMMMLAGLSSILPDWRLLQLGMAVPTAITVFYIWILPESPRWLIAKGKFTEADIAVERFHKYNSCCSRSSVVEEDSDATVPQNFNQNHTDAINKPDRSYRNLTVNMRNMNHESFEESTNLLRNGKAIEQKVTLMAASNNLEQKLSNFETPSGLTKERRDMAELEADVPFLYLKSDRNSKTSEATNSFDIASNNPTAELERNAETNDETKSDAKELKIESDIRFVEDSKKKNKQNIKDLIKHKVLRVYFAISLLQWFSCSSAFYILSFLLPSLGGNRHVNFASGAGLDSCGLITMYFLLIKFGRKMPVCVGQFLCGTLCLTLTILMLLPDQSIPWIGYLQTVLIILSKTTIGVVFATVYIYTVEIFPTVVRGASLSFCSMAARIGGLMSPQVLLVGEYVSKIFPVAFVGFFCIVSGCAILVLPETTNETLPDTIEDCERLIRKKKQSKKKVNGKKDVVEYKMRERNVLREKLFSEEWVDAGNGIIVNFSENKNTN